MTINYKRNLNQRYMIIEPEKMYSGYQLHMLQHNRIQNLLVFETVVSDGQEYFWYDITGKRSFDHILESADFNLELFVCLVEALLAVSRIIKPYLLEEEGILLLPETIFFDHDRKQVSFCYYPGRTESIMDNFRNFMESFLSKMKHENETLVLAAYEVYQRATEESFSLEDTLRLLYQYQSQQQRGREAPQEMQEISGERWEEHREERMEERREERREPSESEKTVESFLENRKLNYRELLHKIPNFFSHRQEESKVAENSGYMYTPADYEQDMEDHPTVYLGVNDRAQGILRYDGREGLEDIVMDHFPFSIGSSEQADATLAIQGISRIHVRISRQGEEYYMEDMNSTNGTWLNGNMLSYKKPEPLNMYDQIVIGRERFTFI